MFGGPLHMLYKAITAVKLSARVTEEHQVPAVAVFWVESEDHDWDEIASCFVLDPESRRRAITLPPPPGAGQTPIGLLTPGELINATIDQLAATLPSHRVHEADHRRYAWRLSS